jgi:hypothetical protein
MNEPRYEAAVVAVDFQRKMITLVLEDAIFTFPLRELSQGEERAVMSFNLEAVEVRRGDTSDFFAMGNSDLGKELALKFSALKQNITSWYKLQQR